jgi:hypothetical protein
MALKFTRRDHLHDPLDVQCKAQHRAAFEIIWASILAFLGFLLGWWAYTLPCENGQSGKTESLEEPNVHYGLIASGNQVI